MSKGKKNLAPLFSVADFEVRPAANLTELFMAFKLTHDQYCKAGLMDPRRSRMRFFIRDLFPTATALVAISKGGEVIGTASGTRLGLGDLPCHAIFEKELVQLNCQGRLLAEGTKFACTRCSASEQRGLEKMSAVSSELLRWLFSWCVFHGVTDWLIVVNPRLAEFYTVQLGFEQVGEPKSCLHVANAPGVLLRLNVDALTRGLIKPTENAKLIFLNNAVDKVFFEQQYMLFDHDVTLLLLDDAGLFKEASGKEQFWLRQLFPRVPVDEISTLAKLEAYHSSSRPLLYPSFVDLHEDRAQIKIAGQEQDYHPTVFALRGYLAALSIVLQQKATAKSLSLTLTVDDRVPDSICADPHQIGRIIVGTIEHALLSAAPGGTITAYIEGLAAMADELELGITIKAHWMSLPINLSQLIAKAGGRIENLVEGIDKQALTMRLPVVAFDQVGYSLDELQRVKHEIDQVSENNPGARHSRYYALNVLVVEDNVVQQLLMKRLLRKWGHQVRIAKDGLEAIRFFERETFDLIMLDIQLPKLDGFQTCRKIKSLGQSSNREVPPIFAMTCLVMPEDRERCYEAEMDGYLPKPICIDTLHRILSEAEMKKAALTEHRPMVASS